MNEWLKKTIEPLHKEAFVQAWDWQNQLTKPRGSLGELESIAVKVCALQQTTQPSVNRAQIIIYAADHGIAEENVSAFPQAVTAEMVKNFSSGGAAISVLSRQHQLPLQVINLGLVAKLPALDYVESQIVAPGTQSFLYQQAMTAEQLNQVFSIAKNKVDAMSNKECELLIAGEMGIANTSSATALVCALAALDVENLTGSGTGLDENGMNHKTQVIKKALKNHQHRLETPENMLQTLGGFEIVALVGTYIRCAQQGIIAVVDGYICSVAALFAIHINPQCKNWLIFSHQSAERGHKTVLDLIPAKPLLSLDLRLGEASGAALVYPLIRSACLLYNEMASFSSASVSEKRNTGT